MAEDFAAPRLAIDVAEFHTYAVDWRPDGAVFLVDGEPVRAVHPLGVTQARRLNGRARSGCARPDAG